MIGVFCVLESPMEPTPWQGQKTTAPLTSNTPSGSRTAASARKAAIGRRTRDLRNAVTLRPREVFELYGIPTSTVSDLCRHPDLQRRLPSTFIPGRGGRKGMRLISHAGLVQWLAKWSQ